MVGYKVRHLKTWNYNESVTTLVHPLLLENINKLCFILLYSLIFSVLSSSNNFFASLHLFGFFILHVKLTKLNRFKTIILKEFKIFPQNVSKCILLRKLLSWYALKIKLFDFLPSSAFTYLKNRRRDSSKKLASFLPKNLWWHFLKRHRLRSLLRNHFMYLT